MFAWEITQHHESGIWSQVAWTLTLGMRNISRPDWQTAEKELTKTKPKRLLWWGPWRLKKQARWSQPTSWRPSKRDYKRNFRLTLKLRKSTNWGVRPTSNEVAIAPAEKGIVICVCSDNKKCRLTASRNRTQTYDHHQGPAFRQDT